MVAICSRGASGYLPEGVVIGTILDDGSVSDSHFFEWTSALVRHFLHDWYNSANYGGCEAIVVGWVMCGS